MRDAAVAVLGLARPAPPGVPVLDRRGGVAVRRRRLGHGRARALVFEQRLGADVSLQPPIAYTLIMSTISLRSRFPLMLSRTTTRRISVVSQSGGRG